MDPFPEKQDNPAPEPPTSTAHDYQLDDETWARLNKLASKLGVPPDRAFQWAMDNIFALIDGRQKGGLSPAPKATNKT